MQDKSHSIVRMPVSINWGADEEDLDPDEEKNSRMLTGSISYFSDNIVFLEWFKLNIADPVARNFLYQHIPEHYTWTGGKWQARKACFNVLGRMRPIPPSAGDQFYLRILLCHVVGAQSLDDLRTYKGITYQTFKVFLF